MSHKNNRKIRLVFNGDEVKYIQIAYISYYTSDDEKHEDHEHIQGGHRIIDYWISQSIIELINGPSAQPWHKGITEIHVETETRKNYISIRYVRKRANESEVEREFLIPNHLVIDINAQQSFHDIKEISKDMLEQNK